MRIKNRRLSIIFKLLLCTAAALGILIQMGAFEGTLRWSVLNYYTLMSNALCALFFLLLGFLYLFLDRLMAKKAE